MGEIRTVSGMGYSLPVAVAQVAVDHSRPCLVTSLVQPR